MRRRPSVTPDRPSGAAVTPDVFDTAAIRSRVLAGWSVSAARFREDANAEEDLALGGDPAPARLGLAPKPAGAAAPRGGPRRGRRSRRAHSAVARRPPRP